MAKAGTYNVLREYHIDEDDADDLSSSPHWVVAVVRMDKPLSYSRATARSITLDVTQGARSRGNTLIITSDCVQLHVSRAKESHVKSLSATLMQSHTNYLVEILPGDWVLAWIVHSADEQERLVDKINKGKPCNGFDDGWKFLGRVDSIRKHMSRDRGSGKKHSRYTLSCSGFKELDSAIYYDEFLSENSVASQDLGSWLSKIGLDIEAFFPTEADMFADNGHILIPAFIELLMGRGVASLNTTDEKEIRQVYGGGSIEGDDGKTKTAPFAYLVPAEVGALIGKSSRDQTAGGIMAYADVLDVVSGVQTYSNTSPDQASVFAPDIAYDNALTKGNHFYTGTPLPGSFLPFMPSFDMRPLWTVLNEYLNPTVNEMYTCLRTNDVGTVSPTLVLRQIPFTTDILAQKFGNASSPLPGNQEGPTQRVVPVTPFSSLPRWIIPSVLINEIDIGRSDATHFNFVQVLGQDATVAQNVPKTVQIVNNPPIHDDFDIQRSGLRPFMSTVACRISDTVGTIPSEWMEIVADHRIGSQFTLNGVVVCRGIRSPICEGDNLELDGIVYHIESIEDVAHVDLGTGMRDWTTTITLTNGMRFVDNSGDDIDKMLAPAITDTNQVHPIYPGFIKDDNTSFDPGHGGRPFDPQSGAADPDDLENEAIDNSDSAKSRFDNSDE